MSVTEQPLEVFVEPNIAAPSAYGHGYLQSSPARNAACVSLDGFGFSPFTASIHRPARSIRHDFPCFNGNLKCVAVCKGGNDHPAGAGGLACAGWACRVLEMPRWPYRVAALPGPCRAGAEGVFGLRPECCRPLPFNETGNVIDERFSSVSGATKCARGFMRGSNRLSFAPEHCQPWRETIWIYLHPFDQGTTSSRATVFDARGPFAARRSGVQAVFPRPAGRDDPMATGTAARGAREAIYESDAGAATARHRHHQPARNHHPGIESGHRWRRNCSQGRRTAAQEKLRRADTRTRSERSPDWNRRPFSWRNEAGMVVLTICLGTKTGRTWRVGFWNGR